MARARAKRARKTAKAKRTVKSAAPRKAKQPKPIELYYWPTPNGWKVSIMLEECGLPYTMIPVNIARGDQFKPEFLAISPNNRMPAIVDPQGPGGKAISVFESGAILQYLGRKTGKFYPADERKRVEVDEWLFWQMGNLGPMAGQANHFRRYAPEKIEYAINRYTNEVRRLYGVMNKRLGHARLPRRRLFDRRHGVRRLVASLGAPGSGHQRVSALQALARAGNGAAGGAARRCAAGRGSGQGRYRQGQRGVETLVHAGRPQLIPILRH